MTRDFISNFRTHIIYIIGGGGVLGDVITTFSLLQIAMGVCLCVYVCVCVCLRVCVCVCELLTRQGVDRSEQ